MDNMTTGQQFINDLWKRTAARERGKDQWEGKPVTIKKHPSIESLCESEWDLEFEMYMRNRLVMGSFRYGLIAEQDLNKYDIVKECRRRLDLYEETNNLEYLVDAGNMTLLEFVKGKRLGKQLTSIDDGKHNYTKM